MDHYVELAFSRLRGAFEFCHQGRPVDPYALDWLLAQADFAVHALSQNADTQTPGQRGKLLELLLGLANLHEYVRHHSVELKVAD